MAMNKPIGKEKIKIGTWVGFWTHISGRVIKVEKNPTRYVIQDGEDEYYNFRKKDFKTL
jgi:hypothetical protein